DGERPPPAAEMLGEVANARPHLGGRDRRRRDAAAFEPSPVHAPGVPRRFARPEGRCYRPAMPGVVVRYHEIALKAGNRPRLVATLREVPAGLGVRGAQSLPGRIVLWLARDAALDEIRARIATTFGVANFSVATETRADLIALQDAVVAAAGRERFASFRI